MEERMNAKQYALLDRVYELLGDAQTIFENEIELEDMEDSDPGWRMYNTVARAASTLVLMEDNATPAAVLTLVPLDED
jgi:hypothetical protein